MAIASVDSEGHLHVGKIPVIDLRFLSQEDLNCLALFSDNFQHLRCDDIVVPKIDRSVFNESAGSRKQTYSRLRLACRKEEAGAISSRRRAGLLSVSRHHAGSVDDSEHKENNQIVLFLRELFAKENSKASTGPLETNLKGSGLSICNGGTGLAVPERKDASQAKDMEGNKLAIVIAEDENRLRDGSDAAALNLTNAKKVTALSVVPFQSSENRVVDDLSERPRKRVRKKDDARRKIHNPGSVVADNDRVRDSVCIPDINTAIVLYESVENRLSENTNQGAVVRSDVVDVSALAVQDVFVSELKRRTAGLEKEAELLGFLGSLDGRWASRRKRRKIVDASDFGEGLPKGWKILLGIRKKEGRLSVDCRKYISPDGQQFASFKDVSLYLMSSVHSCNASHPLLNHIDNSAQGTYKLAVRNSGVNDKLSCAREYPTQHSAVPLSSISTDREKQIVLFKVENLVKAQLLNLLECHKCNLSFADKDEYVQHLLSFHQRNAKRCRPGKSIGEGVIIKDGKYECQICHKAFEEKHRYNGHVGIHVRNFVKSLEALSDEIVVKKSINPSSMVETPLVASEMEPLVDKGVGSVPETSTAKSNNEQDIGSSLDKPDETMGNNKVECSPESSRLVEISYGTLASKSGDNEQDNGLEMPDSKMEEIVLTSSSGNGDADISLDAEVPVSATGQNGPCDGSDDDKLFPSSSVLGEIDKSGNEQERDSGSCSITASGNKQNADFGNYANDNLAGTVEQIVHDERDTSGNGQESASGSKHAEPVKGTVTETIESTVLDDEVNVMQSEVVDTSFVLVQTSEEGYPILDMISEKGDDGFSSVSQKLENISNFDELRLDDIGTSKLGFVTGQDSSSLTEEPADLSYGAGLGQEINPSDWDTILSKLHSRNQLTTVCVWCRLEFNHEGVNPEAQSDSVGFMCPTCKAKISGQLNVLDNGLSMKSDPL